MSEVWSVKSHAAKSSTGSGDALNFYHRKAEACGGDTETGLEGYS